MEAYKMCALASMGYREIQPDLWLKPIGCSVLAYQDGRLQIMFNDRYDTATGWDYRDVPDQPDARLEHWWVGTLQNIEHELVSGGIGPTALARWQFLSPIEQIAWQL